MSAGAGQVPTHPRGNAIESTQSGTISLTARAAPALEENQMDVAFSVRDTGVGRTAGRPRCQASLASVLADLRDPVQAQRPVAASGGRP